MFLKMGAAIIAYTYKLTTLPRTRFRLKMLLPLLPSFLRQRLETNRLLTLLSRELIFSVGLDTLAQRRSVTKRKLCLCAKALQRDWQALLAEVYQVSCLPAAADEAYQLKLLLDSVAVTDKAAVNEVAAGVEYPLVYRVVLSVIVRCDQFDLIKLLASLRSAKAQCCPLWEVWLVNANEHPAMQEELRADLVDQRIHCVTNEAQAYQYAKGLLVHELLAGDCLHPKLVGELANYLSEHDDVGAVYTDHDHLNAQGERCEPVFKPDWNPDMLIGYNYIGSAVFFRTAWSKRGEKAWMGKVGHIPQVLYHCHNAANPVASIGVAPRTCRIETGSLSIHASSVHASSVYSSLAAFALGESVVSTAVDKLGMVDGSPTVSLIIPTRDRLDMLKPCVDSLLQKTTYPNYEIIIVDNQSQELQTLEWFSEAGQNPQIRVLEYNQPFNYAAINNFAVQYATGAVIGLINNDIEVISPGWLDEMVRHVLRPEIGCVGAKLYYADGRIQHAGVILGAGGGTAHSHRYSAGHDTGYCRRLQLVQNVSAVTGACLLVRRELFDRVGGLEEEHLQVAWNDIDLCLKIQEAGYRNLWTPHAALYHYESVSRGRDISPEQRQRYQAEKAWMWQRWGDRLWRDPYYNPNLTVAREDFSLNMLYGL